MIRGLRPADRVSARTADVVVIGAGHAGLAMSYCLSLRGIDHVVLERGVVANSWRTERWESLELLTPNWQTRLPGRRYAGPDPDGFMTAAQAGDFIADYARRIDAPVRTGVAVTSVRPSGAGYSIVTDQGEWRCMAVVLASGACNVARVPAVGAALPRTIASTTPLSYRNPEQLEPGGVLVVGASATGVQLADEIRRSGRAVTLAVGSHVRLPRTYRGLDIQRWMDAVGVLDERYDVVDDIARARRVPSPQLIGSPTRADLDLNALRARGVQIVGRFVGISAGKAQFSGSLRNDCAMADLKMRRLLDRIDAWIARAEGVAAVAPAERPAPTFVEPSPRLSLDVGTIRSVVWATGFVPDYRWLDVPVLDAKGRLRHDGGVVDAPGMYAMGLTFMRRRKSSFIHGAEDDAMDLTAHLADYLDRTCRRAADR
ncbi:MAG TPA: NAD(P)/FAD-dependent oxidoreductase [Pseudomonadales bacterium]|nr:NAD(P)/FAD-dependent oxidoreductase [Pseudomonadales bacterium]